MTRADLTTSSDSARRVPAREAAGAARCAVSAAGRLAVMLASIALLVAACGADGEPTLLGRWELVDTPDRVVIEFRADGTYFAETDTGNFSGFWEELDEGRLATWSDASRPKRISLFRFEDDSLVIGVTDGVDRHHRRIE